MLCSITVCNNLAFPIPSRASRRLSWHSQRRNILCSLCNEQPNTTRAMDSERFNRIRPVSSKSWHVYTKRSQRKGGGDSGERKTLSPIVKRNLMILCGIGYFIQGFRCFPWLALNYHLVHYLNLSPSTLQLVQNSGNLPMVGKPLYGVMSDAVFINNAHRIPYILLGVLLQIGSWAPLAMVPFAQILPGLMACILLSNVGASIAEVANDALLAEFGRVYRVGGLQSYALMASAIGGTLGNLLGGYFLVSVTPKTMFLMFVLLLSFKFATSMAIKEETLGLSPSTDTRVGKTSLMENIKKQMNDLTTALREESISSPLIWVVASVAMVPLVSGSVFCYQTQALHLDPIVLGLSRVFSQLVLLFLTMLYDRILIKLPIRSLVCAIQIMYASSLLLDFVLVKRLNLAFGIPDEAFVLCFSGLAETFAQFKLLPFSVLLAKVCPAGCEGSLTAFLASALCLASIISGFLGVGLTSAMGVSGGSFATLPSAIVVEFLAALLPLCGAFRLPASDSSVHVKWKGKRGDDGGRREAYGNVYAYRGRRKEF